MATHKPLAATSRSSGKTSFSFMWLCERPMHPKYMDESARLDSFDLWPTNKTQKPDALAKAGLFYVGIKDCVKCYFCNGGLWNWYPGDDPWTEHKRRFPKCGFIQLKKHKIQLKKRNHLETIESPKPADINERLTTYMKTPTVQAVIGMSMFDATYIEYACKKKLEAGSEFADVGIIIDGIFKIQIEQVANRNSNHLPTVNEEVLRQTMRKEIHKLRDIHKQLLDARTCKVCMDKPITILFLSCGHLIVCEDCMENLRNCPSCKIRINGTLKTFS
jgi:baculoviral IAP repeat-containing protein 7/8